MTTSSATERAAPSKLPAAVYLIAIGTFLMGTTEFVVAGLLPEIAGEFSVSVGRAGLTITVFAIGMIVGAPGMAITTLRLPRRVTLTAALVVFAVGHVVVAMTSDFSVLLAARFLTALATGAFWAVGSVVAARIAGAAASSRALGIVLGGGMLANVLGVPLGAFSGQRIGWRATFWGLAALALAISVVVARMLPDDDPDRAAPSLRDELAALRSGRLWLALATCAMITGGVLSIYSFIAPLLIERAGLGESVVPVALMAFGVGALIGNVVAGRLGDRRPFTTMVSLAVATLLASIGVLVFSTQGVPLLVVFTLLGLVGLSANPILVALAVRYGGDAPTLATAMPTSIFNLGTAIGTALSGALLDSSLGATGPPVVGVVAAGLTLVPLGLLALLERSDPSSSRAPRADVDGPAPHGHVHTTGARP